MKNFFYSVIILASLATAIYFYTPLRDIIGWSPIPCSKPVKYSIGSFDNRFGISDSQLMNDIDEAARVWNVAFGKPLLEYDINSPLRINFIYDNRQQVTTQRNAMDDQISSGQSDFNVMKVRYDAMSARYESDKAALTAQIAAYDQNLKSYNEQVSSWNSKGGAPKAAYADLQSMKEGLASEVASLSQSRNSFNAEVSSLNSLAQQLNSQAKSLNIDIRNYNTVGASIGEQFSEGEYISDASGKRINIYEFRDENQLIRVMEHEFGHALGLDNVDDSTAIMYYLNEETNVDLTMSDMNALQGVCNIDK